MAAGRSGTNRLRLPRGPISKLLPLRHRRRPGPASQELTTATASISIMKSGPARRVTPTVGFVDLSYNRVPRASFVRALASKGRTDRAALADLGKPATLNVLLEDLLWRISLGGLPYTSTKTELNRRRLPKPARIAISVIGRLVSSRRRLARCTRAVLATFEGLAWR